MKHFVIISEIYSLRCFYLKLPLALLEDVIALICDQQGGRDESSRRWPIMRQIDTR